ncbi:helix-turn-helix domain-containing protein [Acetobacterium sp.]|uniref:helix-turn-helix domain-containing protein n=1 Tax=Acetobacterium sp. TaxID=1872094 RepID=UPI003593825E
MEEVIFTGYESNFAMRLRDLMNEFGTTQKNLAEITKITRQAIAQYMEGSVQPNVERLYKIAKYFHVSADYLLGITDQRTSNIDDQKIHEITGLSCEAIDKLKRFNSYLPGILIPTLNELIEYEDNPECLALSYNSRYRSCLSSDTEVRTELHNILKSSKDLLSFSNGHIEGPLLLIEEYFNGIVDKKSYLDIKIEDTSVSEISTQRIIDTVFFDTIKDSLAEMRNQNERKGVKASIRQKTYAETLEEMNRSLLFDQIHLDEIVDSFENEFKTALIAEGVDDLELDKIIEELTKEEEN